MVLVLEELGLLLVDVGFDRPLLNLVLFDLILGVIDVDLGTVWQLL